MFKKPCSTSIRSQRQGFAYWRRAALFSILLATFLATGCARGIDPEILALEQELAESSKLASDAVSRAAGAIEEANRLKVAYEEAEASASAAVAEAATANRLANDADSRAGDALERAEEAIANSQKLKDELDKAMAEARAAEEQAKKAMEAATQALGQTQNKVEAEIASVQEAAAARHRQYRSRR